MLLLQAIIAHTINQMNTLEAWRNVGRLQQYHMEHVPDNDPRTLALLKKQAMFLHAVRSILYLLLKW